MISRAARVPRICLACRFGLITQRSAGVGFRLSPAREGLARRFYTSDTGKAGDNKVEPFISERDASGTRSEENAVVEETIETPTESQDATTTTNNPSSTETDPGPTRESEDLRKGIDSETNASPDDLQGEQSSSSTPETTSYGVSELPDLSSDQLVSSPESELDDLLNGSHTGYDFEDGISELPELEDESQELENFTPIPKRPYRDRFVHGEALGVPALGLPADAIVINNPNMTRMTRKPPTVIEEQEMDNTGLDWEALAPSEKVEPEEEEIYANIDECRPDTRILRSADIDKLIRALCSGFTVNQLKDYHRDCPTEHRETDNVDYSWIEEMSPWTSVNSVQIRGTGKTSIAQRIVFDKWKIEVQEHVDNLGKAFIWMDPDIFPFLTYGPNNIGRLLWELRRDFLVGEDEKLTLNTGKSRISIIARKSTTYGVLAYIDQAVQQMQTRTIDVLPSLPHGSSIPTISELRELGRITKTSIQRVKEGTTEKLRVSWLPESSEAPAETEDLADTIFRLVVGRVVPGSQNTLQCAPSNGEDEVSGSSLQVQRQARAMSWRDRLNKWYRVVAPIDKAGNDTLPLNLTSSASLPQTKAPPGGNKDATTATFGHILHSDAHTSTKTLSRNRRILSPLTPHPASFSALKPDNDKPLKESTTIVMHLVPRVERKSSAGSTEKSAEDPAVRIKIPVNADADLTNFTIPPDMVAECFVPWQIHDVLLPTEAVDVRFKHERSYSLKVAQPGLRKFLETSQFNLLEGQLRTPSQATLSVPGSWMAGHQSGRDNSKKRDVLYDFRGTEIHQTVEMPWRGHMLRYSSIEAGQHGGQRQEITLQAGTPEEHQAAFQGERKESFLQLVEDIATGKCFSWSEGYKAIKSRQLEDYSYNLPEEELTEDIIVDNEKFDSRGRLNFKLYEEKPKPKRTRQKETFNYVEEIVKVESEPDVETTPESEVESRPEPTSEPTSEPKAGEDPEESNSTTDELMTFLDTYAKPKAFKDSNDNEVYGVAAATKHWSPRSRHASDSPKSGSPRVKDKTRENVLNEYFSNHRTQAKSPTSQNTTSESNTIFTATETTDKHTRASNKPAKKSRKYTLRDLEKPASKSSEDMFAAQFASRVTGQNRARDPNAVPGFFDPPPQSEKKSTQKKGSTRAKGGWSKRGRQG
ncbi:hypothetical protein FGRMN_10773 [Fusarium graminum]|nr:hypothetical protein FGRMN_10773 [Fusarium graminum]